MLAESERWTFVVTNVFQVTGRDHLFLAGHLETGAVSKHDWFRATSGVVGSVADIEFARVADQPIDQMVLRVDAYGVAAGDQLTRCQSPLRAG